MTSKPRQQFVQCLTPAGLHQMAYREWGDPANHRVLVCVHGLSRVGADFDELAAVMSDHYRVVCPDVVGRGNSDWLADPAYYQTPIYVADMITLLARLNARTLALVRHLNGWTDRAWASHARSTVRSGVWC